MVLAVALGIMLNSFQNNSPFTLYFITSLHFASRHPSLPDILIHIYFPLVKEVNLCGLLSLEFKLTERQRLEFIHCCIPSSLIVSGAHLFLNKCILINEWTNTAFIKVIVFLYSKFITLLWWFTGLSIPKPPYL